MTVWDAIDSAKRDLGKKQQITWRDVDHVLDKYGKDLDYIHRAQFESDITNYAAARMAQGGGE